MHTLYDTTPVPALDRYEYYRAAAASELVPVSIHGRPPSRLIAMMSGAQIGDFTFEVITWSADCEAMRQRTERLIRAGDPESYRIFLSATPGVRIEQADHRVELGARDIALYDLSRPSRTTHPAAPMQMRVVMLTFPRELVPIDDATVRPLIGTATPRRLPGRGLIAQFLIGLTEPAATDDPGLADALREGAVGLIRQQLGKPPGSHRTPAACCIRHTSTASSAGTSATRRSIPTRLPGKPTSHPVTCTPYSRMPTSRRCNCSSSCVCARPAIDSKIRHWPRRPSRTSCRR